MEGRMVLWDLWGLPLPSGPGGWNRVIPRTQLWEAFRHSCSSPCCLLTTHQLPQLSSIARTHPEASCQEVLASCSLLGFPGGLPAGRKARSTTWFCHVPISPSFSSGRDRDGQRMAAPRNQPKPPHGTEEAEEGWDGDATITSGGFSSQGWKLSGEAPNWPEERGKGCKSFKTGAEQLHSSVLQGARVLLLWKPAGVGEHQPNLPKRQLWACLKKKQQTPF